MKNTDTIAAFATALSDSGIGIIRISGSDAFAIGDKVFRGKSTLSIAESHTIHYGHIVDRKAMGNDPDWKKYIVDEVMVNVLRAPRTYTAEDTVEINCHGGVLVMKKVLDLVLANGARIAEPGEFTKRAFLNGRIDLSKAEAVMDLISSRSEYALNSSVNQLKGNLSEEIRDLRDKILYETAFIESALDDPEHISLDGYPERLYETVQGILGRVDKMLSTVDNGRLLKEGISTVIVGKPNVGKSSFLNALLGEDRAIVTSIAGTTRDVLQENVVIDGIGLKLIDTAGIRDTEDIVEQIGVDKARKYASDADLIVYVVDTSVALDDNDREILEFIGDKKTIILLNKTDLTPVVSEDDLKALIEEIMPGRNQTEIIRTSMKEREGIAVFEETVKKMFFEGSLQSKDEIVITNARHKEALSNARESLSLVLGSIEMDMPEDFYSIDLMSAYLSLGNIIGEELSDDLVDEIFSKFCMGK